MFTITVMWLSLMFTLINFSTALDCFWNSCHYKKFSSKSPYNCIRGDIRDAAVEIDGCDVISIWTLIRHGKRSPGGDFRQYMIDAISVRDKLKSTYKKGTNSLCAQDVENLINWQVDNELLDNDNRLTKEGYQEMFGIGKRLREAFIQLLDNVQDGNYTIRSAHGHWVENGVDGFIDGLSNNKRMEIQRLVPENDTLAIYFNCPKYMLDVRRNTKTYREFDTYLLTEEYLETKKSIENRIGMKLTDNNITALYDLCRYVWSAVDDRPSPWCALFSVKDLEIMEYAGDLRHYYRNGYGNEINVDMGEILLADFYKHFKRITEGHDERIAAYFSHATMMDMVISALGVLKDEQPLTGASRDPNRNWKTSKASSFAANIIATLFRCGNDYKVGFYLNEDPLTSMCDNGICTWSEFENKFKPFLNTTLASCYEK